MTHTARHLVPSTSQAALHARFAGLGIAALASLALMTATPAPAYADEAAESQPEPLLASAEVQQAQDEAPEQNATSEGEPSADPSDGDAIEEPPADTCEAAEDALAATDTALSDDAATDAATADVEVAQGQAEGESQEAEAMVEEDVLPDATDAPATSAEPLRATSDEPSQEPSGTEEGGVTTTTTTTTPPAAQPVLRNGWDASHTHYYMNDVAQKGVIAITENGVTHHYLFDASGALVKGSYRKVGGRIYVSNASGELAALSDAKAKEGFRWLTNYGGSSGRQRYYLYRDKKTGAFYALAGYSADGVRHYTRPEGFVVRKSWTKGSRIYLATKDGKLAALSGKAKQGWLVTKSIGQGKQRYYLYRDTKGTDKGAYFARPGYDKGGYAHFTRPEGYVVTGVYLTGNSQGSRIYLADKEGRLASLASGKNSGWVESSSWGAKNKRYLLIRDNSGANKGAYYARLGFSTKSYAHYTTKKGYVKTKTFKTDGKIFVTDSKGKIASLKAGDQGWLKTAAFSKGKKRYYLYKDKGTGLTAGAYYAVEGYSTDGYAHLTTAKGYIATDGVFKDVKSGKMFLTNAEGLATESNTANIIERYLTWAVDIANDPRYGYSQPNRLTGANAAYVKKHGAGDFDCSSLVLSALKAVGLKVGTAYYTGDMMGQLVKHGWTAIRYNGKTSSLKRGDILLEPNYHVEFYLGKSGKYNLRVGAHGDEFGGIGYGAALGDQRQKGTPKPGSYDYDGEVSVRRETDEYFYSFFSWVLRYTG